MIGARGVAGALFRGNKAFAADEVIDDRDVAAAPSLLDEFREMAMTPAKAAAPSSLHDTT